MNRLQKTALFSIAAAALSLGAFSFHHHERPQQPVATTAATAAEPTGYEAAVADALRAKKNTKMMADAQPGSWSRRAAQASAEMGYAQLTGDYEGYYAADASLAQAFVAARAGIDSDDVGPLLLKAQLSYELHRLQPALDSLKAPEKQAEFFHDQKQLAMITSLRGAITFQLGKYDEGIALLEKSIALDPTASHKQRLAIALAKIGRAKEALAIFDETSGGGPRSPRTLAWIETQRAKITLERGDRAAGRKHLNLALSLFPGNWQNEELLAELDANEGHKEKAALAYRALVKKTHDPEFMDALADLIEDSEEAMQLKRESDAIYAERLVRLPEASYGHALEHFLKFRTGAANAERTVELATKNRDLRPNGEARTRLAQAYVKADRLNEAREEILAVTSSKWVSAESYATAAIVLKLAGDLEGSKSMEAKATAINPHAMSELADWLAPDRKI